MWETLFQFVLPSILGGIAGFATSWLRWDVEKRRDRQARRSSANGAARLLIVRSRSSSYRQPHMRAFGRTSAGSFLANSSLRLAQLLPAQDQDAGGDHFWIELGSLNASGSLSDPYCSCAFDPNCGLWLGCARKQTSALKSLGGWDSPTPVTRTASRSITPPAAD